MFGLRVLPKDTGQAAIHKIKHPNADYAIVWKNPWTGLDLAEYMIVFRKNGEDAFPDLPQFYHNNNDIGLYHQGSGQDVKDFIRKYR